MCATLWYVRFNLGFEIWPGGGGGRGAIVDNASEGARQRVCVGLWIICR